MFGTVAGGVGGFLGRQMAGRYFGWRARSDALKDKASEVDEDGKPTAAARRVMLRLKTYEGIAKSSFDVRRASALPGGGLAGEILGGAQIDLGLGRGAGIGGFRGAEQDAIKARAKAQEDAAKLLAEDKDHEAERKAAFLKAGGNEKDFKTGKQIAAERQGAFAEQLRTPMKAGPFVAFKKFTTDVRGDTEAARSIDKSTKASKDVVQLESDIGRLESDISDALKKLIGTSEITAENIRTGNEKLITELARARAVKESLPRKASIDARTTANADLMKWERMGDILNQSSRDLDRKKAQRDTIQEREGKKTSPSPKLAGEGTNP